MKPSLSVIIPAYNGEAYLKEAVDSVRRQNWDGGLEILVIDDGSTDRTAQIARALDVTLLQKKQGGAASARNEGLRRAAGEYILLLDADDVLADGALEEMYRALTQANASAVFTMARDFISPELTPEQQAQLHPRPQPYSGSLGGSLIRKAVFDAIGMFDASLSSGETVEWLMKLRKSGMPTLQLPLTALHRRLHMTNTGRLHRQKEMANYAALLRARMKKN